MKVLAIIPAYNEEKNILTTVHDLSLNAPKVDYIVINDGSKDRTGDILDDNEIPHIDMPINVGLTGAVRTGFDYAIKKGYDAAIQFDGDGQHDASYLRDLMGCFESDQADIVIGSRFINTKKERTMRGFGSNMISMCIKITTRKTITDPTSGMRLFSRKIMQQYINHMNYSPEPDTIALLLNRGVHIQEIPVRMRERIYGTSYLSVPNAIKYMCHMMWSILIIQWICE